MHNQVHVQRMTDRGDLAIWDGREYHEKVTYAQNNLLKYNSSN